MCFPFFSTTTTRRWPKRFIFQKNITKSTTAYQCDMRQQHKKASENNNNKNKQKIVLFSDDNMLKEAMTMVEKH